MPLYQNLASFMHERLNIEFTYKPMTHLSGEAIFRHLSFKPRKELADHCPETRKWNLKYPFKFQKVKFEHINDSSKDKEHREITLDGLTWELYDNGDDKQMVVQPCGRERHLSCKSEAPPISALIAFFMNHFFQREGTTIEVFHVKNHSMRYVHYLPLNIRKLHIEVFPDFYGDLSFPFLAYFEQHHFQEITIDGGVSANLLVFYFNFFNVSTDSLMIINNETFDFDDIEGLSRKIHVFHSDGRWSDLCRAATEFRRDLFEKYLVGSYYKGYLEKMPNLEDFLDTLRIDFNGEFKYSEDTIGVCAEMTGDRELFISYQLIDNKNLFTAEILEKGTTKHYQQLPVDLQKKFRGFEDQRNRIRVITDNDSYKRVKWVVRRVY